MAVLFYCLPEYNLKIKGGNKMEKQNKSPDPKFNLLINQIIISFILFAVSLSLMLVGGEVFEYSKAKFKDLFNKPIDIKQVVNDKSYERVTTTKPMVSFGMGGEYQDVDENYYEEYVKASSEVDLSTDLNKMIIPLKGNITSAYGWRIHPKTKNKSFHTGVDIGAKSGTNIKTVLDGVVEEIVFDDSVYGNYIIISHENNTQTMYAHCSKIIAESGDEVIKGDTIAQVGSTGLSTGPHLHFEVRVEGKRLNPEWFIKL